VTALHVIAAIAPRYGGPTTAVLGLCRALEASGVTTLIATTDADGDGRLVLPIGDPIPYQGTRIIAFRRWASESLKLAPSLTSWLRAHVHEFDVVHIHGLFSHACIAAANAAARARIPYVVAPLGTLDPESLSQKSRRKAIALRLWGARALQGAAAVQCTAPGEFAAVATQYPSARPVLLPLGVGDDAFGGPPAARERLVVSVARLTRHKGLARLLDAFDAAVRLPACRHWRLVIAGSGEAAYAATLAAHARRLPAAHRIDFAGWMTPTARQGLLSRAALFALPSHHENFGLAVLEALAAGVPAVITDGVQLGHWVAPARAGWVAPATGEGFETMLQMAMADDAERARRAVAARELAERFRWSVIAAETAACYRRACAEPATMATHRPFATAGHAPGRTDRD
jgi:glycosyltransferase involved in cell wall biosynthesis